MNNIITKYKSYEQLLASARSTLAVLGGAVYLDAIFLNVSTLFIKKYLFIKNIYLDTFPRKVPATSCRIHERWSWQSRRSVSLQLVYAACWYLD